MKLRTSPRHPVREVTPTQLRAAIEDGLPDTAEVRADDAAAWIRVGEFKSAAGADPPDESARNRRAETVRSTPGIDAAADRFEREMKRRGQNGRLLLAFGIVLILFGGAMIVLARPDEFGGRLFMLVIVVGIGLCTGGIKLLLPKSNVLADAANDDWDSKLTK